MGLSLDPHKNHLLHHQHNQDHTQSQILISKHVVGEDDQNPSGKDQEFHNQYLQQVQNLHQHHQLLCSGGDIQINTQSSRQPPQPPKKRSYLPSSSSQRNEYASLPGKMGHQTASTSRLAGLRNKGGGGEIVEVQGGHIIRSIGRKDRHSKVCTAKGPRDRRVRLSAHTAIEFYDVQDRLGYDRPSKAVDWLMNKAKAAIDELEELPAWKPRIDSISIEPTNSEHQEDQLQHQQHLHSIATRPSNEQLQQPNENNNSSFLPSSVDTDSIADTIKSFFPTGASTETNNIQHHHNFQHTDLVSRISSQSQDLRLSLQSFQDPMLLHHRNHQNEQEYGAALFSGNPQMDSWNSGGDTGWSENPPGEMGRLHRMVSWNSGGDTGGGAFLFNLPQPVAQPMLQPLLFSQRGPLQSSNTPSLRAWIDPSAFSAVNDHQNQASLPFPPAGIGFASGFSGFRIPARIQGEEEEHDGVSNKPSSASSNSRH